MDPLEPLLRLLKHAPSIIWISLVSFVQWFVPESWYAKDVSRDIVLITGAGAGLGREMALEYARLNASLVLWDVNVEGLKETNSLIDQEHSKQSEGEKTTRFCLTYQVDVSDRARVYAAAQQVQEDIGARRGPNDTNHVSVLVNNAGIYHGLMFQELTDQQIERIFKINILAHFWTVRAFLPAMIRNQRGHIVEIASVGGISGLYKQVDYCATKFATVGFEESLSLELMAMGLGDKVRTTVVCPLFFQSNLFTGFDSRAAPIMSCRHVARQAVMGMRCNHPKILLPPGAHLLDILRPITPRRACFVWAQVMNWAQGIRDIKGAAACETKLS